MKNERAFCILWLVCAYFTENISSLSLRMLDNSYRFSPRAYRRISHLSEETRSNQKQKRHINPLNKSPPVDEIPAVQILPQDNTDTSIKNLEAIVAECQKTPIKSCQGSYVPRAYFTDFDIPYDEPKKAIGENAIDAEEEAKEKQERQLIPKLLDQDSLERQLVNPVVFVDQNLITDIIRDPSVEDIVFIRKEVQDRDLEASVKNRCENAAKQLHILKKLVAIREDIRQKNRRLIDRFPTPDQIPSFADRDFIPENRFPETTDPSGVKVLPDEAGIDSSTTTDDVSTTATVDVTDLIISDSTDGASTQHPTDVEFIIQTETTTSLTEVTSSDSTTDPTELTSDVTETTGGERDLDGVNESTTESTVSTTASSEITSLGTDISTDESTVTTDESTVTTDATTDGTSTVGTEVTETPSETDDTTTQTSGTDVTDSSPISEGTTDSSTTLEGSTTQDPVFDLKRLDTEVSTSDSETTTDETETSGTESTASSILDTSTEVTSPTDSETSTGDQSTDSEKGIDITTGVPLVYTTLLPPTANGGSPYHEEVSISNHTKLEFEEQVNETIIDDFGPGSGAKPVSDSDAKPGESKLTHVDQKKPPVQSDDLKAPAKGSGDPNGKLLRPSSSSVSSKPGGPNKSPTTTSTNQQKVSPPKKQTAPGNQVSIDGNKVIPLPADSLQPDDVTKRGSGPGVKGPKPGSSEKGTLKFPDLPKVDVNTLNKNTPLSDLALYLSQKNNTASAALKDKIDHAFHHAEVNVPLDLGPLTSDKLEESNKSKLTQKELKNKIELAVPNAIVADGLVNTFFIILLSNNATKLNLERWTEDQPAIEVDDLCVPLYENGTIHDFLSITRLLKGTVYFKNSRSKVPIRIKRSADRKCWSLNKYDILKKGEPVSTLVKRTPSGPPAQPANGIRNGPTGAQFRSEPVFRREPIQYVGEGVGPSFGPARHQQSLNKVVSYPAQGVYYTNELVPERRLYDSSLYPGQVNVPMALNNQGVQFGNKPSPIGQPPQIMGNFEPRGPRYPREPSSWGEPPPFREGDDAEAADKVSHLSQAEENKLLRQFFRMKKSINAELDSFIEEPVLMYRKPNFVNKSTS
nr:PREDICTED: uncharacterized protein LOC109036023 isoform X2 [Bemisia tabaci]